MGRTGPYDEEAALLPRVDDAALPYRNVDPSLTNRPKKWRGKLLCCFAGCDLTAWATVIVFQFAPFLLFGYALMPTALVVDAAGCLHVAS